MYEWTCPICGQKFSTPRLASLHKSECKRPTPPTDSELLVEAVELLRITAEEFERAKMPGSAAILRTFLAKVKP